MVRNYWTNTNIASLPPTKAEADHIVWYPKVDRFGVRFSAGKPVSFVIMYYLGGRDRKLTIGKVSQISLEDAIGRAKDAFHKVAQGIDPAIDRQVTRNIHSELFVDYVQPFLDAQRAKGTSKVWLSRQETYLKGATSKVTGVFAPAYFAALHNIPVKLITRKMVAAELDKLANDRGNIAMTNARATLSKYFTWMITRDIAENNPVFGTEKITAARLDRTLSVQELVAVWNAATPDWQYGRLVRQLILTGARREQIGGLKKSELDVDSAMITLPRKANLQTRKRAAANGGEANRRGGSKNGERFEIPLSKQSLALFAVESDTQGDYVFGECGFSAWSRSVKALSARIGDQIKEHWSLHDLRRTFATLCVQQLKLNHLAVDAALNHLPEMKRGVAGIYQQADLLEERVEVMNAWGAYIEQITAPTKPDLKIVKAA